MKAYKMNYRIIREYWLSRPIIEPRYYAYDMDAACRKGFVHEYTSGDGLADLHGCYKK